jgi:hypothetical protein
MTPAGAAVVGLALGLCACGSEDEAAGSPAGAASAADVRALCEAKCARAARCGGASASSCTAACVTDAKDWKLDGLGSGPVQTVAECYEGLACNADVQQCQGAAAKDLVDECRSQFAACPFVADLAYCELVGLSHEAVRAQVSACIHGPCEASDVLYDCVEAVVGAP